MEPFKNRINGALIERLGGETARAWASFDQAGFIACASRGLDSLELKGRVDHVARVWRGHLPDDYREALAIVLRSLPPEFDSESGWGDVVFYSWLHSYFVQVFGLDHPRESLEAMVEITKRGSCEFAVRPYLVRHSKLTRTFLRDHVKHPSPHVRRWISEGTRPRLPWGERLVSLVADPSPNIPLLQALRRDPSEYVRTSVANHVGDIAKDHPGLAVALVGKWQEEGFVQAEWIARRALRHLVKQGDAGALGALGFPPGTSARISGLAVDRKSLAMGEEQVIRFTLNGEKSERLSIDYGVDYRNAKGGMNRKVFKLAVRSIAGGEVLHFEKKHRFKPVSIRRLFPGEHAVTILVNGLELGTTRFMLTS
ncbi:MAG: DNA alkylation repair protein [Verrucomicrobia bacterium]|nr:DNA alkylation repair protein [Verrucomicrobiota bacterium]